VSNATIVRFTEDLRLADSPALAAAVARGGPVVLVYIIAPIEKSAWPLGPAARGWLERSLVALDADPRPRFPAAAGHRGPGGGADRSGLRDGCGRRPRATPASLPPASRAAPVSAAEVIAHQ
jgi:deoxyribodipyrimidine photo-lyase